VKAALRPPVHSHNNTCAGRCNRCTKYKAFAP